VTLILYDTLSRSLRAFQPIDPSEVRLYCCGPTVYNFAHIGNLRTYIFEDLLRRVLEFNGFKVRHVVNITDVGHLTSDADEGEDKMEAGSRRTGETVREMAARFTRAFQEDWASLNLREPSLWCKATDHIAEQIEFIRCIEATGCTYIIEDGVYFDTSRQPNYGFLARLRPEQLRAGARVDVGAKCRPTDFALWKFSPKGAKRQMEWQSHRRPNRAYKLCLPPDAQLRRRRLPKIERLTHEAKAASHGRVEMWRGGSRLSISVSAPFVWRCLTGSAMAPFPHPPGHRRRSPAPGSHRTWRADFPHQRSSAVASQHCKRLQLEEAQFRCQQRLEGDGWDNVRVR
jgi:tRNA synthetases class I (C) catalytic domain